MTILHQSCIQRDTHLLMVAHTAPSLSVSTKRAKGKSHPLVKNASIYDEIERQQLNRREIRLTGPVDSDMAHVLQVKLAYLVAQNRKPITIYLNTGGGGVVDGLAVYDAILQARKEGVKITVQASGACMSMGTVIMQAATTRESTAHAAFLLHELSMIKAGSLGALRDAQEEAERLQKLLNDILMTRSGLTAKELQRLTERKDLYLSAEDAKKYGIIDRIV
jgi:ATP-dependent Clp endopeptidase proteolytic subunit ClpP